jgi:hypothetical protein
MPDLYAEWEVKEEEVRVHIGADVSIMRDRSGGRKSGIPITMKRFRERIEKDEEGDLDMLEWGGCGCMTEDDTESDGV